jgi:hypothetical protein
MRPDLPLILIVLGLGVALAIFVDGGAPPSPLDPAAPEAAASLDSLLAPPDPVLVRCFSDEMEAAGGDLPGASQDPQAVIEEVSAQVEEIRELRFSHSVDARFLSDLRLRRRVSGLVESEVEPKQIESEEEILGLLGAIPPQTDLLELAGDTLGSQVIGLYDLRTQQLLVRSSGEAEVIELITLAHELDHALTDQRLHLKQRVGSKSEVDRELAYTAVVEGDATLLMQLYSLAHIGLAEQLSLAGSGLGAGQFDQLPDYVQRSLVFPYLEGLRLACHRYVAGGWTAVNRLYARPPASTDEVIFPDRYGDGPPTDPRDPGDPGGKWRRITQRQVGAAELEWLFSAPGGDPEATLPEPRRLVAAWAGGELELWARGDERALGIALVESSSERGLCGALGAWYQAANPGAVSKPGDAAAVQLEFSEAGRSAVLVCAERQVRLGIAPDPVTALHLAR